MVQYVLKRTFYAGHIAFDLPQDAGAREAIRRRMRGLRGAITGRTAAGRAPYRQHAGQPREIWRHGNRSPV